MLLRIFQTRLLVRVYFTSKPERLLLLYQMLLLALPVRNGEPLSGLVLPNFLLVLIVFYFPSRVRLSRSWLALSLPLVMSMHRLWRRVPSLNWVVHLGVLLVRLPQLSCQLSVLGIMKSFQIFRPRHILFALMHLSFLPKLLLIYVSGSPPIFSRIPAASSKASPTVVTSSCGSLQ